ncbi:MAG: polysaccharide biosynthesis protein [Anaerolinea sp.]|nr:polysaccharide biosynthesis protein [Anaerolinea sp.]
MSSPDITDAERARVIEVVNSPYLSMGPQTSIFEKVIADFVGAKHAVAVNSGTAGLHLCVRAAGIEAGDLVITTPFSFVASSNVLLFEKAIPVFVDVDPITGNLDVDLLEKAVEDLIQDGEAAKKWLPRDGAQNHGKLKAILAVDVFGQPADYERIVKLVKKYNLKLIEDSCESLGAEYKSKKTGLFGDYGVFAFYPNKQITTGEGGMIVTNDDKAAGLMRALRNQGRAPGDNWLQHTELGYNYRIDELSAALGAVQMTRIEELLDKRQKVADMYAERLAEIQGIEAPGMSDGTTRNSWFVYVIKVKPGIDRDQLAAKLTEARIPVRPYFLPIHLQPYMAKQFGYREGDYPVTEDLGRRGLALPFSGVMTEEQVDTVCQVLRRCLMS